jgi:GR25 family glycosyltransferase involved in LPS biosynthesis
MHHIEKAYYINLDHRTDRNEQLLNEIETIGNLCIERFSAIRHSYGAIGCASSHIEILKRFAKDNISLGLILEDDVEFLVNAEYINQCVEVFVNDPNLDVLCLAFNAKPNSITPYNEVLNITTDTQTTGGYLVKSTILPSLIQNFELAEEKLRQMVSINEKNNIKNPIYPVDAIDQSWKLLQSEFMFAIPVIRIARQRESYSDILHQVVKYNV